MSDQKTELALLPTKETALQVFSTPKGLSPYLDQIKAELDAFVPDVTTKKGRDAIASIAYKVAKSKTALDNIGKDLVADLKDVPKKIDAERKWMRDTLDQWRDDVRAPLTAWEDAEEKRVAKHKEGIAWFGVYIANCTQVTRIELEDSLVDIHRKTVDESWEEFEQEAHLAKARAIIILQDELEDRKKREAEMAELIKLRQEKEAREQKEREERIAREAAERAQREAEAKAQAEREAVIRREQETKAAAERRELELKLAAERAEREKAEAIQREQQAKADAERKAAEAVEAEKRRVAEKEAAEVAEAKRREQDKAHRGAINRAAMEAFINGGMSEDAAKLAVTLIAKKAIPAISIAY